MNDQPACEDYCGGEPTVEEMIVDVIMATGKVPGVHYSTGSYSDVQSVLLQQMSDAIARGLGAVIYKADGSVERVDPASLRRPTV